MKIFTKDGCKAKKLKFDDELHGSLVGVQYTHDVNGVKQYLALDLSGDRAFPFYLQGSSEADRWIADMDSNGAKN